MKKTELVLMAVFLLLVSCRNPDLRGAADRLLGLEGKKVPESVSVQDLQEATREEIRATEKKIEKVEKETTLITVKVFDKATYYKLLGLKYMSLGMYGEAKKSFEDAISIVPENEFLYFHAGVCSARMIRSAIDNPELRKSYSESAMAYYKRAIELKPGYVDANYGMAELLTVMYNDPYSALPYISRALDRCSSDNFEVKMSAARIYAKTGNTGKAQNLYSDIINLAAQLKIESSKKSQGGKQRSSLGRSIAAGLPGKQAHPAEYLDKISSTASAEMMSIQQYAP